MYAGPFEKFLLTMPIRRCGIAFCLILSACASYERLPLAPAKAPPTQLTHLTVDSRTLPFPALAAHRFDPSDGLDETEVAMLAVANNADLKLARDDAAIAYAQAFSAGLLPDPQLALSRDMSNTAGPGGTKAFSLGLSYDINAVLMHLTSAPAARADARKTDLALLWQEWQVVSQARLLYVKLMHARRLASVLDDNQKLFADRVRRIREALARGLLTSDALTPNLTALQDIQRQIFELERQTSQSEHELNALLGLAPGVKVVLQEGPAEAPLDENALVAAEADLRRRRPDLLALEAGYEAEDQRYRGALLAQFPALNVGLTRARDSSNIYSNGVGVTLSLPFLNRNRGNIAIEKATRQKLYDEYGLRLQGSRHEVARILDQYRLDAAQLVLVDAAVQEFSAALARSELAFRTNNVDALLYANARAGLLAKQVEQINLQQAVAEQRVGLLTVLGIDPPIQAGKSTK